MKQHIAAFHDSLQRADWLAARAELARGLDDPRTSTLAAQWRLKYQINMAVCLAQSGDLLAALRELTELRQQADPKQPRRASGSGANKLVQASVPSELLYNAALCEFKLARYEAAGASLEQLLADVRRRQPELMAEDCALNPMLAHELEAPHQSRRLRDSRLIEALALQAAVAYKLAGPSRALKWSQRAPIRSPHLLDPVSLHNQALYRLPLEPGQSLDKLRYLVGLSGCGGTDGGGGKTSSKTVLASWPPGETHRNLAVAQLNSDQLEPARQLLSTLPPDHSKGGCGCQPARPGELQLVEAQLSSSAERRLSSMLDSLLEQRRRVADGNNNNNNNGASGDDQPLLWPVLTRLAQALWLANKYQALEASLLGLPSELRASPVWVTLMAHALFMQDSRHDQCSQLYEQLLPGGPSTEATSLLEVEPMVLANLCVCYVLTGRNSEAEALIKDVEADERLSEGASEQLKLERDPAMASTTGCPPAAGLKLNQPSTHRHLTVINLVIGVLYCTKFNYTFGMARVFRALEPLERKLNAHTWQQAKLCIVSLLDRHCKRMVVAADELLDQVGHFLRHCELHGAKLQLSPSNGSPVPPTPPPAQHRPVQHPSRTVAHEARYLRRLVLDLVHN